MKTTAFFGLILVFILALVITINGTTVAQGLGQTAQNNLQAKVGSGFTYQGRLLDGGSPANGAYDLAFKLFDAPTGGAQLFTIVSKEDVVVTDGLNISSAGHDGVYVGNAARHGVTVESAGSAGLAVGSATFGVWVDEASLDGVRATTLNSDAYGGRFVNNADSGSGAGLYARGNDGSAPDIILGANGLGTVNDDGRITSDPFFDGSDIRLFSNDNLWIDLDELDNHSGSNVTIRNSDDDAVWSVNENGDMVASGSKSALVEAGPFGQVKLYALESPENWFEDFGSASLVKGEATVSVEPKFAATVNLSEPYQVFLTPLGDCGLYVAEKSSSFFRVQALDGAKCSIDFDYRLVAKRAGYEAIRLEPAKLRQEGE